MTGAMGVDLRGLQETEQGIRETLDILREVGMHGQEESGSPIEQLGLGSQELGDPRLADTLDDLLARAHYVFRELLGDGRDMVRALADTRTTYQRVEDWIVRDLDSLAPLLDPRRNPLGSGDDQ